MAALNAELDAIPADLENQQWHGHVHRQDYQRPESEGGEGYRKGHPGAKGENGENQAQDWGVNLQNIIEAGPAFESLIDHPSWLAHVRRFIGGGNPYIDEAFCTIRDGQGAGSPLHSGAHKRNLKTQFRYHDGAFRCGEINILIALDDCGPGDGATLVVPGAFCSLARGRACGVDVGLRPRHSPTHRCEGGVMPAELTHPRCPQAPTRAI